MLNFPFKIFSKLEETAARFKERVRMITFGKSYEGRQLKAVEVNFNLINDTFHLS